MSNCSEFPNGWWVVLFYTLACLVVVVTFFVGIKASDWFDNR